jgi:heptosyltransferase-2
MNLLKKLLIIQTAFIGDVVLATSLIEKISSYYPDVQIDFLLRKGNEALLVNNPHINEVLIWDKMSNKRKNLFNLLKKIRSERYDKVINVQRFAATGLLTAFSGADETIGFDKNPFSFLFSRKISHRLEKGRHEIDRNQELIRVFTDENPAMPRLYPSEKDFEKVSGFKDKPYITISPASVWFTKQYPAEKWISIIGKLEPDLLVYLCGGASDKSLCGQILQESRRPLLTNLSGELSYLESAALMRDARMNFVNDSAPMHFASAINAPVAAIYCSTVPAFGFGPLSEKKFLIETRETLDCRPCGLHGYKACPKGHFKCAYGIEDDQLAMALK